jgi:hypothetical protein
VIIRKGENISAKEVEDLLFTSPAIGDVAVIGLPDDRSGERACAIVVPADPEAPPTLKDVFDFCSQAGLMTQKVPEQFEIVDVRRAAPPARCSSAIPQAVHLMIACPAGRAEGARAAALELGTVGRRRPARTCFITPRRCGAGATVRRGRRFLRDPFDEDGPQTGNPGPKSADVGVGPVNAAFTGDPSDFTTSDDAFEMGAQAATHWDALAHVGYEGLLYNDTPDTVVTDAGAARLGIEHYGPIVTRGVLLDIARLLGVEYFEDAHAITDDDRGNGEERRARVSHRRRRAEARSVLRVRSRGRSGARELRVRAADRGQGLQRDRGSLEGQRAHGGRPPPHGAFEDTGLLGGPARARRIERAASVPARIDLDHTHVRVVGSRENVELPA